MSFFKGKDPVPGDRQSCDAVSAVVVPRSVDLGGMGVRRALPHTTRRTVGPFVFFDHFGPAEFRAGEGLDVRPHPHIGLSTLTYLYDGEIMHRDSLGSTAPIRPGEVNWMTAGRGIVHSERTAAAYRADGSTLHGLQFWIAMRAADEENDPSFRHIGHEDLPSFAADGVVIRLVAGSMFGATSPLVTTPAALFADVSLDQGARIPLDPDYEDRAVYVQSGAIDIQGEQFEAGRLLVLRPGERSALVALAPSRIAMIGGDVLDGPRHVWWNFVSSRKERIEQAKEDWKRGTFGAIAGDDAEFIPLPQ